MMTMINTYPYGNRRGAIGDPLANISVRYDLLGRESTLFLGGSAICMVKKIERNRSHQRNDVREKNKKQNEW